MDVGSLSWGKSGRVVALATHNFLGPGSRIGRRIPLTPFSACLDCYRMNIKIAITTATTPTTSSSSSSSSSGSVRENEE
jgi:hypothetical protein